MQQTSPSLTIDLAAVAENARRLKATLREGTKLIAVVKANAFGMGALDVGRAALAGGADLLAVGRGEEVRVLRAFGVQAPVLVQGETPDGVLAEIASTDTAFTVWDRSQLPRFREAARAARRRIPLHVEVDTGMHRLGVDPDDAVELAREIVSDPALQLAGTLMHLACADEPDPGPTLAQWRVFADVLDRLRAERIHPGLVHVADSGAVLRFPQLHAGAVRAGLLLFGVRPTEDLDVPLVPVVSLHATIIRIATVPIAEGVGYGMRDASTTIRRVATVAIGYADGVRGSGSAPISALVRGRRVRQVGHLSLDLSTFDVTHVPSASVGDQVTLVGVDGEEEITLEAMALETELSPWKLLASLSLRLRRSYLPLEVPAPTHAAVA